LADNVAVTAGSGTTIGTDQVGTVHYQKVKLVNGTAESEDMIASDIGAKANALRVAPANDITDATYIGDIKFGEAIPTGTNIIGAVKKDVINYTPVNKYVALTGAQTDGIVWSPAGGKQVAITDLTLSVSAAATVTLEWDKTGGDEAIAGWDLAANGGVTLNLETPLICSEDDADLVITTTAGNVKVTAIGYEV
jgi:hypothetical protein